MKYLSFVVPSYNASKYLDKVIPSLLVGGDDVEIIVVNDGSKDNTLEIAKRYEELYPNIVKAIDKENGGHGSTINKALEIATGLYFKCVDADDWLEENALKTLLAKIKYHHEKNTLPDLYLLPALRIAANASALVNSFSPFSFTYSVNTANNSSRQFLYIFSLL